MDKGVNQYAMNINEHEQWFINYFNRHRLKEKDDPAPLDLKYDHTFRVLNNAKDIVQNEEFSENIVKACLLSALYHDVARFEQYLKYRTFRDRESINHGILGLKILACENCLKDEKAEIRKLVRVGVGLHNSFALPHKLSDNMKKVCYVVRDADKLDILRIIDGHLASTIPYNPTVVLNLPDDDTLCSDTVIKLALDKKIASYSDLKCVNDFRILLITWFFDLHFKASKIRFIKDGYAKRLLLSLPNNDKYGQIKEFLISEIFNNSMGLVG